VEAAVHVRSIVISLWPAYAAPAREAALFGEQGDVGGRNELVARAVPDLGRRLSLIGERTARFLSLRETVLVMREEVPKADVERLYSIAAAFPN